MVHEPSAQVIMDRIQRDPWPVPDKILQQAKLVELATREDSPKQIKINQSTYENTLVSMWNDWKSGVNMNTHWRPLRLAK